MVGSISRGCLGAGLRISGAFLPEEEHGCGARWGRIWRGIDAVGVVILLLNGLVAHWLLKI